MLPCHGKQTAQPLCMCSTLLGGIYQQLPDLMQSNSVQVHTSQHTHPYTCSHWRGGCGGA